MKISTFICSFFHFEFVNAKHLTIVKFILLDTEQLKIIYAESNLLIQIIKNIVKVYVGEDEG